MTKRRAPLSVDAALARVVGQLPGGYAEAAELVGRAERTVRNWGDPDTPEDVPVNCAITLDLAYQASGGTGAPLYESYGAQLDLAEAMRFGNRHELLQRTEGVIREGGQAHAALVRACRPDATPADLAVARRELAEAYEEIRPLLAILSSSDSHSHSHLSPPDRLAQPP